MSRSKRASGAKGCSSVVGLVIVLSLLLIFACVIANMLKPDTQSPGLSSATPPAQGALAIAYSPEKAALFNELADGFNKQGLKTPDGRPMQVNGVVMEPEAMIEAAVSGNVQAVNPDSSIWLDQIDRAWQDRNQSDSPLVGETSRYAISPVVIAMWEDVARSMGYPDKRLGWEDILNRAKADPDFKWSHPSTSSASGLLATLAMFYAGAGKTRGLTIEDVEAESTLNYVAQVQKTVRQYGEGEWPTMQRVIEQGRSFLDAFVTGERLVVYHNQGTGRDKLVAVYPAEGTMWEDHPLALLEAPGLSADQRLTFQRFRDYLLSKESQQKVLAEGFRPTDLSIPLTGAASPISAPQGVDPAEPKTALQIPGSAVVQVVRDVWWHTKRNTNVFLVADTSGSMRGDKMEAAREAMRVFVEQIKGNKERVGLVTFSSAVNDIIELDELGSNRVALNDKIAGVEAGGDTALLDAVRTAYMRLQRLNDRERINAIVVMTDGRENNSNTTLNQLVDLIQRQNTRGVPVVIFSIAYGGDADYTVMNALASASKGQAREGDLATIRDLYKILATYF